MYTPPIPPTHSCGPLPIFGGEGVHPLADACDFARYCSGLDFWAATDHAEAMTPIRWAETRESIRQCNAVSGDAENPDTAAFVGFEWTQVGRTPTDHYGHKNIIFPGLQDEESGAARHRRRRRRDADFARFAGYA